MLIGILVIALVTLYLYLNHQIKYWQKCGIKCRKPTLLFGNLAGLLSGIQNLGQIYTSIYREFKDEPFVGFYKMSTPGVLIRDVKLAKDIMIKDFDSFGMNDIEVDKKVDPLLGRNPFSLVGEEWKYTRSLITPAFSSGKMKIMFPLMEITTKNMNKYIESNQHDTLEAKELCAQYTTDNVASCAYGLEAKSFQNTKSEFREMGRKIFNLSLITNIKTSIIFVMPTLAKWLKIRFISEEPNDYFTSIVRQTLKHRIENNIVRNDFLDMMQQVKVKVGPSFTDVDVAAHAIGFFIDGFETSSITMSFALYCIAKYPAIQNKLRQHINEVIEKSGGFTYEAIQDMSYLDMVLNESLRIYPPGFILVKRCTKEYTLSSPNSAASDYMVQPGTPIVIPLYAYQTDEKYFPNPDKFDPERFSEERKQDIEKCSFMPFGEGPRACLGQRFAILQVKVAVASIVREFALTVNRKTIEPIQFDPKPFLTSALGGLWIDFKKI